MKKELHCETFGSTSSRYYVKHRVLVYNPDRHEESVEVWIVLNECHFHSQQKPSLPSCTRRWNR